MARDAEAMARLTTARQERMRGKAEAWFNVYYEMGPTRSLEKLHDYLTAIGLKTSMNTLKRYSVTFNWQLELQKRDTQLADIRLKEQASSISQMEDRHVQFARAGLNILVGGMKHYLDALEEGRPERLDIDMIMRAGKNAIAIERLAMGEPTDRRELYIQLDNIWLLEVTQIFLQINSNPDENMRLREFGQRLKAFVNRREIELGG